MSQMSIICQCQTIIQLWISIHTPKVYIVFLWPHVWHTPINVLFLFSLIQNNTQLTISCSIQGYFVYFVTFFFASQCPDTCLQKPNIHFRLNIVHIYIFWIVSHWISNIIRTQFFTFSTLFSILFKLQKASSF